MDEWEGVGRGSSHSQVRHPVHLHQGRQCAGQIVRVDGSARAKCCWPYDQMTNDQFNHLPVERVSSKVVHFFFHFIIKHQPLGDREKNYNHDITDIAGTSNELCPLTHNILSSVNSASGFKSPINLFSSM